MSENSILVPFLKWAGGKRWFTSQHAAQLPTSFERYFEPFLGSGAVYFHLRPQKAVLSDMNPELINVFNGIKVQPALVSRYLRNHHRKHSTRYYYQIRSSRPRSVAARAARTLYLNRTCWNALYRVNKKGEFNVPIGTKASAILASDNFAAAAELLRRAKLIASDFEVVVDDAKRNDFLFIDPPYTVRHNLNGFLKYNENIFSWEDQIRLRDSIDRAVSRGAKVLVTNADHESVRDLYADFSTMSVERASVIAADGSARGRYSELLVRCW